jgi:hypothetical protein
VPGGKIAWGETFEVFDFKDEFHAAAQQKPAPGTAGNRSKIRTA